MRTRSTAGFAVLLTAILLLNAAGLCAALLASPPAHKCCPDQSSAGSPSRCCITSGAPVIPVSTNEAGLSIWAALPVPGPAPLVLPSSESRIAQHPLFASSNIFLKFHQLLI